MLRLAAVFSVVLPGLMGGCQISGPPRASADAAEAAGALAAGGASIPLFANYYTWYATGDGPHGKWTGWGSEAPGLLAPEGTAPARLLPSGEHEIAGMAYPLAGPYDSTNREIVRWHIRLAQAAGIEAFMVDWWGPGHWQAVPGLTYEAFVEAVLPVAEEEGFQIFLFDELPQFYDDLDTAMEWVADALETFSQSPAWLRIDGKPAYALYQFWEGRMTPEEATRFKDHVEARVGPVFWIVDKMRARPADPDDPEGPMEFYAPEEWLALDWIDCIMSYGTFHNIRIYEYDDVAPLYRKFAAQVRASGKRVLLPVHPGHDNSRIQMEPWVMPRREGATLRGYLRAVEEADADFAAVTSFNEWPETTIIEPSSSWEDPYLYLRILAEWKGQPFSPPPLPPGRSAER